MLQTLYSARDNASVAPLVDYYARVSGARHHDAGKLLSYWRDCMRYKGGFVMGRDIPARAIAPLLRNIAINEPLPDESDMRIRLAGELVARRFEGDIKGALLSQIFPQKDFKDHLQAGLDVLHTGKPVVLDSRLRYSGGVEHLHTEVVLLPLQAADRKTSLLLAGLFYFG